MDETTRHLVIATAVHRTILEHFLASSWEYEPDPLEAAKAFSESVLIAETKIKIREPMAEDHRLEMTEMFHSIVDDATDRLRRRLGRR